MWIPVTLLLAAAPQQAKDVEIGVRLREWFARYDGAVTADGRPDNGTRLDAASDLGLDSNEFAHDIQVSLDAPKVGRFSLGYWQIRLEGDDVLAGDVNFDGGTFPAGTAVESKLAFDVLYFDYEYSLLEGPFQLGLLAGGRYLSGEAELEGGGAEEHANLNRPLFLPGVHAGGDLTTWLHADARIEGLAFGAHNVRARYVETEAELSVMPVHGLSLGLGYRQIFMTFKAREESLNFDLDGSLGGFFLSVGYAF